jgi:hypothetical protein
MANTKISGLTAASALVGTEEIPGVQGGGNVKITPAQIKTYAASDLTGSNVAAYSATGSVIAVSNEDNDANTFLKPGVYYAHGGASSNLPDNAQNFVILVARQGSFGSGLIYQTAIELNGANICYVYVRVSTDSTPSGWGAWSSPNT